MSKDLVKATTYEEDITTIKDVTTQAFLISGKILQSIQDEKKYKDVGYKTFAEAVKIDLGIDKPHAYRLMRASETYELLVPIGTNLPTAESQLRPLIGLQPEQQVDVWTEVAKDRVPTAKAVKETVQRKYPKCDNVTVSKKAPKVKELPNYTPKQLDKIATLEKANSNLHKQLDTANSTITMLQEALTKVGDELHELKQPQMKPAGTFKGDQAKAEEYRIAKVTKEHEQFQARLKEDSDE